MQAILKKIEPSDLSRQRPHARKPDELISPAGSTNHSQSRTAHSDEFLLEMLIDAWNRRLLVPIQDNDIMQPHLSGRTILHIHQIR